MRALIYDLETTGVSHKTDSVIEVGCITFDVTHASILQCYSALVRADSNAAQSVNGITLEALGQGWNPTAVWEDVAEYADDCDLFIAYNSPFDRGFTPQAIADSKPWLDAQRDVEWPRISSGKKLVEIALAHGLGISHAHRALADCLTIARLLERIVEMGINLESWIEQGLAPKAWIFGKQSKNQNDLAKLHGFSWDSETRKWSRKFAVEKAKDYAASLPFKTEVIMPMMRKTEPKFEVIL